MADRTFHHWPFFEAAHRALATELEAWCDSELARTRAALQDDDIDASTRALVRSLGEAGWLRNTVALPSAAPAGRGPELDVRSLCLCRETLARFSGLADFAFAMQGLGTGPISLFGSDAQKTRILPAVAAGRAIAAFALSEEQAGSDIGALRTAAVTEGEKFVLDGSKTWISNAGIADHYVVFARVGSEPGTRNLAAFLVESDRPGCTVSERLETIAPHPLGSLVFEGCRVPRANLIGEVGDGFRIAMATLDVFRSTVGAAALGMARRALDESVARVQERVIGSEKLADKQITQAKLADMAVAVDAAALLVYRAAWTKDVRGGRITREAAMAKLAATEAAQSVIDQAVQLFGGLGIVRGSAPEELYREIRALRIYEGTSEIQRLIIARQVLSRGRREDTDD